MAYIFCTMKRAWLIPLVVAALTVVGLVVWRSVKFDRLLAGNYPELDGGVYSSPLSKGGVQYLVPPNQIYDNQLGAEGIPAINEPKYVDIYTADEVLADEVFGLDVEAGGQHYFYPFQILNWHEVVNDTLNGVPLAITYSTMCGSPVVYERTVNGAVVNLSVSGKIYNSSSLLTDGTSSTLWHQLSGLAIAGDQVGDSLTRYPSVAMPWSTWRDAYPNGRVLSIETGYAREYGRHPYGGYETSKVMYFPVNHLNDHLPPKEKVFDVTNGQDHIAYAAKYLGFQNEPNLTIGQGENVLNTVGMMDFETGVVKVFNRQVADKLLTFVRDGAEFTDQETGTTWNLDGLATAGELRGTQLEQIIAPVSYVFCYSAMYPQAVISGDEIFDWDGDGVVEGALEGVEGESTDSSAASESGTLELDSFQVE